DEGLRIVNFFTWMYSLKLASEQKVTTNYVPAVANKLLVDAKLNLAEAGNTVQLEGRREPYQGLTWRAKLKKLNGGYPDTGGAWSSSVRAENTLRVTKIIDRRIVLENQAKESESLVFEINDSLCLILSTTRHVKPCWKQRGPPRKAKYSSITDSELVP
ncbi:10341_t:CDS:2, partial [Entrophospora sp. SA101]